MFRELVTVLRLVVAVARGLAKRPRLSMQAIALIFCLVSAQALGQQFDTPGADNLQRPAPRTSTPPTPKTTVGMPGRMEQLVLPGTMLKAKQVEPADPVVVRIADSQPHGDRYRYTIVYWGMEKGKYDLRRYLERVDGSDTSDLPPIPITVDSVMVVDNGHLNPLESRTLPLVGGYRSLLVIGGILWVLVSVGIFVLWRTPRPKTRSTLATQTPLTWADRLRPLLEKCRDGKLDASQQAALERLILSFWRDRLGLTEVPAAEAIHRLKSDPQAGVLLAQLESWLHSPNPDRSVDLNQLLEPYRKTLTGTVQN